MRNICYDFNNICGEMARRLASLFAFLKSEPDATMQEDPMGLSLYAEPAYWLYGLLSFCAKACESKIAEANGTPIVGAKDDGGTPALEATGKTLSLMQTVVMSFGRNQGFGKPDLPIHHLHIYFPVQLVHKLVERMEDLRFTNATPEDGKKYKHNSESETNSAYIVVGTYEGVCPYNTFCGLPDTPRDAGAYEHGLLDGNLEVPVWPDVQKAILPTSKAKCQPGRLGNTPPPLPDRHRNHEVASKPRTVDRMSTEESVVVLRHQEAKVGSVKHEEGTWQDDVAVDSSE